MAAAVQPIAQGAVGSAVAACGRSPPRGPVPDCDLDGGAKAAYGLGGVVVWRP
jgi:hypothetical protein